MLPMAILIALSLHLARALRGCLHACSDPLGAHYGTKATSAISAALLADYTAAQVDADYRTASAQDAQTQAAIAGAPGLPDGPGPGRFHDQPPLGCRPRHGNGLEHRRRPARPWDPGSAKIYPAKTSNTMKMCKQMHVGAQTGFLDFAVSKDLPCKEFKHNQDFISRRM